MERFISLHEILDNLLEHPLLQDISFERAVNYTVHFMRLLGRSKAFINKTAYIDIEDYRGLLPCDFNKMIQVRLKDSNEVFRASTDSFHMSENKSDSKDLTYKLQNSVIFTSLKEGTIEISYEAFAVDDEGYPLIPDNSAVINALEAYIKYKHFTILFDLGKIQAGVYQNAVQEYTWAIGQAQSSMIMPSIDEMEAITNSWNTLIARTTQHRKGFINNGTKELIKVH